jgi:phage-related protein
MYSFIWKDQDSYLDYGIVINKLPSIVKPEKKIEEIEIDGRNGDLTIDYNCYKPIAFSMVCTLIDDSNIDDVKAWLDGYSNLIFSWQDDRKYNAKSVNKIDIAGSLENYGEFTIEFKAQPFGYKVYNDAITITTNNSIIFNPCNYYSEPIIKVFGTGSVDLNINDNIVNLTDVSGYVTVNTPIMDAYKDNISKNNDMSGDFQTLKVGKNYISWVGAVTKLEITPNWRWL